tara:strand:- start:311 stop:466 length:156 start_codon:yes stop_codon:yes gene_type:complete
MKTLGFFNRVLLLLSNTILFLWASKIENLTAMSISFGVFVWQIYQDWEDKK